MQLHHVDFPFTLLTPCFSGTALGKHDDHAEMRIPPIRGHVRFWHRALFGANDANRVWGSTNGDEGQGSRVGFRLTGDPMEGRTKAHLLPHADPASRDFHERRKAESKQSAVPANGSYSLVLQRLVGCTGDNWDHAQRAVRLWLLLGCLGLRSNRAAGSVWPEGDWVPQTADSLNTTLRTFGLRNWSVALIGLGAGRNEDELRETASDTLDGNSEVFGGIKPHRKPSPSRFKIARLAAKPGQPPQPCLLAVAPAEQVTVSGSTQRILHHAENLLKPKPRWKAHGPWQHLLP